MVHGRAHEALQNQVAFSQAICYGASGFRLMVTLCMLESGVQNVLKERMICVSMLAVCLMLALTFLPPTASATDPASSFAVARLDPKPQPAFVPFPVGEELLFELRWMGVLAGHASMAVSNQLIRDGHDVYHMKTIAQSSPFFSAFYHVRDEGETYVDVHGLYPRYFSLDQREGGRVVQRTVTFDPQRRVAIYTKNQQAPREIEVPPMVQDSLSSLYVLRTLPLQVGHTAHLHTFANGRIYDVEIQVLRREQVVAYWGAVDTLVVRPLLRFQEILRQTGEVLIWLTDDARRLPVRMKTAIKVGSIEATLIEVKGAQ
jgi:hypothetical protein